MPTAKFEVHGLAPERDPLWHLAGEPVHREFWRVVVTLVKERNEYDRARGLDRFGHKLPGISRYTRAHRRSAMGQADPNAPPLTPADAASRTVAWFDGRAFPDHAEFFWRKGWGKILGYHQRGAYNHWSKRNLPIRDVIGISPKSLRWVQKNAALWWENRRKALAQPVPRKPVVPPLPMVARGGGPPKIEYIPPGGKPRRPSNRIQVYTEGERQPAAVPRVVVRNVPPTLGLPVAAKPATRPQTTPKVAPRAAPPAPRPVAKKSRFARLRTVAQKLGPLAVVKAVGRRVAKWFGG